jgi:hypothetical protein
VTFHINEVWQATDDPGYYVTDPADPDAPVLLSEYGGMRPGSEVRDAGPVAPLPYRLTVTAIYEFRDNGHGGWVAVICKGDNGGTYELSASSLVPLPGDNSSKED